MQLRNIISQLALAIGVAFGILFMQWRTTFHFGRVGESLYEGSEGLASYLLPLSHYFEASNASAEGGEMALMQINQLLIQQSTLMASNDYFMIVARLGGCFLILFLLQRVVK